MTRFFKVEDLYRKAVPSDDVRNDPVKFREWQLAQQQKEANRSWQEWHRLLDERQKLKPCIPDFRNLDYSDADYDAAQGSHFNPNGWGK